MCFCRDLPYTPDCSGLYNIYLRKASPVGTLYLAVRLAGIQAVFPWREVGSHALWLRTMQLCLPSVSCRVITSLRTRPADETDRIKIYFKNIKFWDSTFQNSAEKNQFFFPVSPSFNVTISPGIVFLSRNFYFYSFNPFRNLYNIKNFFFFPPDLNVITTESRWKQSQISLALTSDMQLYINC